MRFISWRPSPFRKRSRLELSIRQEQSESNKFSIISCSSAVLGLCLLNTCQAKTTESTEPWHNVFSSANIQQSPKPACHDNPTAAGTKAYQTKLSLVSMGGGGLSDSQVLNKQLPVYAKNQNTQQTSGFMRPWEFQGGRCFKNKFTVTYNTGTENSIKDMRS